MMIIYEKVVLSLRWGLVRIKYNSTQQELQLMHTQNQLDC